ncbi:hypothetical protein AVEN_260886-1 [Araneus ventricosus]|uniref:CUB domain-containing protein n=1 Tax=Araneus ventricosus TaxID=182803 RepID=A0A4Y2HDU8_ARAVE|nr:hypothetical protein AVEN_260886-1 [Araneus ventricosus]
MEGIKIIAFALFLWGFQLCTVESQNCAIERDVSGKISSDGKFSAKQKCWTIPVPPGHFIHIKINSLKSSGCDNGYLRIKVTGTSDVYQFCSTDINKNPITALETVTVTYNIKQGFFRDASSFELEYTIKTIECLNKNRFKWSNKFVPKKKSEV